MAYQISSQPILTVGTSPGFIELMPIEQGSCLALYGRVLCISSAGLVRSWDVARTAKWLVGGSPALVGTAPAAVIESDASFAPTVALALGGTSANMVRVQCTGLSGATIRWSACVTAIEVVKP
jgi:hypothetical protein